ncbi:MULTISPECIES: AsmA family protein [Falsihalocynthiibacter]|uniref:AsmA family protein n=2 Tax=Roseobacteraceae TaxID=2854170 RepID=UPI00300393D0
MRWIFRAFMIVATLAVLGVFAIALIPGKKLAEIAAGQIAEFTGREVTLSGDVTTKIFPRLSVTTGPIAVANAPWAEDAPLLTAEGLTIGVELLPLLQGNFEFRDIKILQPNIRLSVAKDGRKNWDFSGKPTAAATAQVAKAPSSGPRRVTVEYAGIKDGEIHFYDDASGLRESLSDVNFEARFPESDGEIRVSLSGQYKGASLDVQAGLDRPMGFLLGDIATLDTTASLGGAKISYTGKLGLSGLVMDGDLVASIAAGSPLLNAINAGNNAGPKALSMKGKLVRTPDGATYVRGGEYKIGTQVLRGDIDFKAGKDRPVIKGIFTAQDLSLPELQGASTQSQTSLTANSGGWSTAPIDVSGLSAVDAEISLTATSLDLGVVEFGPSQVLMKLNAGRAVFDLKKVKAYGGDLAGEFVVNGRGGLSVGGDLTMKGVQTDQLLGALVDFDRLVSPADVRVKFLGVGNNLDAIVKSLSGQGAINVQKGVLKGVDVEQMIRTLDLGYRGTGQRTVFESIDATFNITDGIMSGTDLAFRANGLIAEGRGKTNLSQKLLVYRLTPTALVSPDGTGGVRVPLLIRGPWADLRFSLDLEAIVNQELSAEKAVLEKKLKDAEKAAKANAIKKLGVKQKKDESLEDAARRTLEETATKELLKLLGQN